MFGRYLTIVTLISAAGVGLAGCAGNRGGKVTLQKTLGPGGRDYARARTAGEPTGSCLNLPERVTALRAETAGLALHSRDYDLGQISTAARDHRVAFTTDPAARDLRVRRALSGENAPLYRVSLTPAEILDAAPLSNVLGITVQSGCTSVTFRSGVTYKVEHGDQRSLNLIEPATHERREYIWSNGFIVINVFAPVKLKDCDGGPSSARFERISMRVAWGDQVGAVKLVEDYAKLLDVPVTSSYLKFQDVIKGVAARAETLDCKP